MLLLTFLIPFIEPENTTFELCNAAPLLFLELPPFAARFAICCGRLIATSALRNTIFLGFFAIGRAVTTTGPRLVNFSTLPRKSTLH